MTRDKAEAREWTVLFMAIGAALATTLSLAACNTTEGAGEDIESAGEAIQEEADDAN
jgi:predicted small secreted protein